MKIVITQEPGSDKINLDATDTSLADAISATDVLIRAVSRQSPLTYAEIINELAESGGDVKDAAN